MTNTITFSRSTPTSDTVLIVMDGTPRTHTIAAQVLRSGYRVVVTGPSASQLVPFVDASVRHDVWTIVADPADPAQIDAVIERATETMGPDIMIIDPGGRLSDVGAADRKVA